MLFVFWLWIDWETPDFHSHLRIIGIKVKITEKDKKLLLLTGKTLVVLCFSLPVIWAATSSVNDVLHPYYNSRELAAFLKDNNLQDLKIMTWWVAGSPDEKSTAENTDESDYSVIPIVYQNTNTCDATVGLSALPYFDHNLFMKF